MSKQKQKERNRHLEHSGSVMIQGGMKNIYILSSVCLCALSTVYLMTTNASAMRSLHVSALEGEITQLMIERSELSIQEAHLRHFVYTENRENVESKRYEISGYVTLPEYSSGNILALSE